MDLAEEHITRDHEKEEPKKRRITSHIFNKRPNWKQDEETENCVCCGVLFSIWNRRHHCRACGKIFCARCSSFRSNLSELGYIGEQRTCQECHDKFLQTNNPELTQSDEQHRNCIILEGNLTLVDGNNNKSQTFIFHCTKNTLTWFKDETSAEKKSIEIKDVLTVKQVAELEFCVYYFPKTHNKLRQFLTLRIVCKTSDERDHWVNLLHSIIPAHLPQTNPDRGSLLLVLINPIAGKGRATLLWRDLEPILRLIDHLELTIRWLEYAGQEKEIAQSFKFQKYQAIICLGGEDTFRNVINGLMNHSDSINASKTPLALIPSGLSAAFSTQFGYLDAVTSGFSILRGEFNTFDILRVDSIIGDSITPPQFFYSGVQWGTTNELYQTSTLLRIATSFSYLPTIHGKIRFVRADSPRESFCTLDDKCSGCKIYDRDLVFAESFNEYKEEDWEIIDGEFILIAGSNLPKGLPDLHTPYSHLSDGAIDLIIITKCTRAQLFNLLSSLETGEFVNHAAFNLGSFVHYLKVKAFTITPQLINNSTFTLDGQQTFLNSIRVFNVPGAVSILTQ